MSIRDFWEKLKTFALAGNGGGTEMKTINPYEATIRPLRNYVAARTSWTGRFFTFLFRDANLTAQKVDLANNVISQIESSSGRIISLLTSAKGKNVALSEQRISHDPVSPTIVFPPDLGAFGYSLLLDNRPLYAPRASTGELGRAIGEAIVAIETIEATSVQHSL